MKRVALSARLSAVASMVTNGNRVCDVGCDHGFVSVYLVQAHISPHVLAMDVGSGPLGAAREHIAEYGLDKQIETRLSDGLHNYHSGEADTLICAGMGGRLMRKILSENKEKMAAFKELILQPQSELEEFRGWLREQGYRIADEKMVEEDGKFYPMMRVVPGCGGEYDLCKPHAGADNSGEDLCKLKTDDAQAELCKLNDRYGPLLLRKKDSVLADYLRREERIYNEILAELAAKGLTDLKRQNRYREVSELLKDCRAALKMVLSDEMVEGN